MMGVLVWDNLPLVKVEAREHSLYGLSFCQVTLSPHPRLLGYRLRKVGKLFQSLGVRRLLVPDDFPHWGVLRTWGLHPVEVLPTLQGLGGEMLLAWLTAAEIPPPTAWVTLSAPQVTPAITQVAHTLAPHVGQIALTPMTGAGRLQQSLLERYGMAPASSQKKSTATLCFCEKSPGNGRFILQLHGLDTLPFCKLRLKSSQIPPEFPRLATLALLLQRGAVEKSQIDYT